MAAIGNLSVRHRPVRRLGLLYAGLLLYGAGMSLMIRANLGLDPWDVFHQGAAKLTGLSFGTTVIAVGAVVLLLWIGRIAHGMIPVFAVRDPAPVASVATVAAGQPVGGHPADTEAEPVLARAA